MTAMHRSGIAIMHFIMKNRTFYIFWHQIYCSIHSLIWKCLLRMIAFMHKYTIIKYTIITLLLHKNTIII